MLKAKVAIVDATQAEPSLPALKRPSFMVEEGCPLIPGNELPDRLAETRRYCCYRRRKVRCRRLSLAHGEQCRADRHQVDRASAAVVDRPGAAAITPEFAEASLSLVADQLESLAAARSVDDVFLGFEERGVAVRLDPRVAATAYRGASISLPELAALRGIADVDRLGHLQSNGRTSLTRLSWDRSRPVPDTLYIDCSADGLPRRPTRPIFEEA